MVVCNNRTKTVYVIAGNFRGRKLSRFGRNKIFTEKTFTDCTKFVNSYKTSKFAKVFSLEGYPLYGELPTRILAMNITKFIAH